MTEVPPFLFVLTSTALVLGAAITVRGLLGFRPITESAALQPPVTEGEPGDALVAQASSPAATVKSADGQDDAGQPTTRGVRDLKEPFVMTFAGVFICIFSLLAISALIHSG